MTERDEEDTMNDEIQDEPGLPPALRAHCESILQQWQSYAERWQEHNPELSPAQFNPHLGELTWHALATFPDELRARYLYDPMTCQLVRLEIKEIAETDQ